MEQPSLVKDETKDLDNDGDETSCELPVGHILNSDEQVAVR